MSPIPPVLAVPSLHPLLPVLEPSIIYHYTSIETLMKIVDSRQIWATSIEYLNDTAERKLFLERAAQRIGGYLNSSTDIDRSFYEPFMAGVAVDNQSLIDLPSVASFSREDDSLPQWRAYTPSGLGVSIGFDVSTLRQARVHTSDSDKSNPFFFTPSVAFSRVDYLSRFSDAQIDEEIRRASKKAVESMAELSSANDDTYAGTSLGDLFRANLEERATFYKDESFRTESEYRLVVSSVFWSWNLYHFRTNRSSMVPFVKIDIPMNTISVSNPLTTGAGAETAWNAIKRVVIGPTSNQFLTARAVKAFFLSRRLDVEVAVSDISFRDW